MSRRNTPAPDACQPARLKLCRPDDALSPSQRARASATGTLPTLDTDHLGGAPREVLPFPRAAVRPARTPLAPRALAELVAGRVGRTASTDHDFQPRFGPDNAGGSAATDVQSTGQFITNIQNTLESMQRRLDRLRRDADDSMKFPTAAHDDPDHDLPPAA